MARQSNNISYGADELVRSGMWAPAAPGFLDKREQREAARQERRFTAVQPSFTQSRIATRRAYARESAQVETRYARWAGQEISLSDDGFDEYAPVRPVRVGPESSRRRSRATSRARFSSRRSASEAWAFSDEQAGTIIDFEQARADARRGYDDRDNARGTRFDEEDVFADTEQESRRPTLAERFEALRHALRHRRAERDFDRSFEDAVEHASRDEQAPRAAVYETRMGRTHQRTARMQASQSSRSFSLPAFPGVALLDKLVFKSHFAVVALVSLCIVFSVAFVYPAAQDCYLQIRAKDQAVAEYEAIAARNAEIEQRVAALQTDEGMEALAHQNLGWVREGENAVSVSNTGRAGVDPAVADQTAAIAPGSVPAPTTWYSPVLDAVFGYPAA